MKYNFSLSFLAFLFLSSCAPMAHIPSISKEMTEKEAEIQREIVVKEFVSRQQRLQSIASPILIKNAALCGDDVVPYIGTVIKVSSDIDSEFRDAYERLYGVTDLPTVLSVAAGSPAAGKLNRGDVVVGINGEDIGEGRSALSEINNALDSDSVNFSVVNKGKKRSVSIKPVAACNSPVNLVVDNEINAYADGREMYVTTGMMRFVKSDNELALVVGHELAHNMRGHIEAKQGNALIGALIGAAVAVGTGVDISNSLADIGASAYSQSFEMEADYVGLYYVARAGYGISSAPDFWRRMATENPGGIHLEGSSHPSTAARFLSLEASAKEISAKRASGKKLIPEERK